ncbi:MAG: 1-acyl-sn-glycerol-3-phosphate acyltransferase, partial [Bdellovibrionales bacterium]|nr:1-acyl-sn-glycerol-3-phosphate acyltransferase [Bdellovibrionales bacterium]
SLFPEVGCIVKAGLTRSRILTYLIDSAGYIKNSGESLSIDSCAERLFNGESLIVFPEGTRSDGAKLRKFQRGAAALALRGHCTVVPVFYTCVPAALQKKHSWFEVPDRAFELSLEVGTAFSAQEVLPSDIPEAQARRRLTRYFENLFECRLGYGRATA